MWLWFGMVIGIDYPHTHNDKYFDTKHMVGKFIHFKGEELRNVYCMHVVIYCL